MKLLVASVGMSLESFIVKRFEHAAWYLFVDTEAGSLEAIHHRTPHDRHGALSRAVADRVDAVVAAKFGEHSLKVLNSGGIPVAIVHGIPGRAAVAKILSERIPLTSPEELIPGKGIETGRAVNMAGMYRAPKPANGYSSDTARGQHHLQQYGGRGH